jgi:hypothetical protein
MDIIDFDPANYPNITKAPEDDCTSSVCRAYSPALLATLIVTAIVVAGCMVIIFLVLRKLYLNPAEHEQHERRASQILPLYLGSGQDVGTQGAGGGDGDNIQLRRLSRRVSAPLPLHIQQQRSRMADGADREVTDGSPRSVGSDNTVIRHELSRSGLPGAPVRSESVDTLPRYEEVETEGGWKKARLSGGVGRAM